MDLKLDAFKYRIGDVRTMVISLYKDTLDEIIYYPDNKYNHGKLHSQRVTLKFLGYSYEQLDQFEIHWKKGTIARLGERLEKHKDLDNTASIALFARLSKMRVDELTKNQDENE